MQKNALRHVIRQAIITKNFDKDEAERIGNAHEDNSNTSMLFSSLPEADKVADLQNNKIGQTIGEQNKDMSNYGITKLVLGEFYRSGLYTVDAIEKDSKQLFRVSKTKLTIEEYKNAIIEVEKCGENGKHEKK